MRLRALLPIFSLCFLGACQAPSSPDHSDSVVITLRIKGTVTDATTNEPVMAQVDIVRGLMGWLTGTNTDATGRYTIESLAPWDGPQWKVLVTAGGYEAQTKPVEFTEAWQTMDFQLERQGAIPDLLLESEPSLD